MTASKDRRMNRRQALQAMGALSVAPAFSPVGMFHPLVPSQEGGFTPRWLSPEELETVTTISEIIIPETDTPGATAAKVYQYVDFVMSEAPENRQNVLRQGLLSLDGVSRERYGKDFNRLETEQQVALLDPMAEPGAGADGDGAEFFREIKALTVEGYYRSEVGMREELGFHGADFLDSFDGCRHPEHLNWKPTSEEL